jgi:osmoprotectant transport system substrate-binding protein
MRLRAAALLAVLALLTGVALTGCGLQAATSYVPASSPGLIQPLPGIDGARITVGSKNFTEQLVLGKIAVIALQTAGFDVVDRTNIPGSVPARKGMTGGKIDMEWEYTGTAWLSYLGHATPIPDPGQQYQAVRKADLAHGLTWLAPAPMNNTYAFAVRSSALPALGNPKTLSDLATVPVGRRTFCVESEFASRNDGFQPMLTTYGLRLGDPQGVPRGNVRTLDTGAVYEATAQGACTFGEVFTTDGRIESLHLTVLKDDKKFFPNYNVAPVLQTATLRKYPQLRSLFAKISPLLTDETMQRLNARVDVAGEQPGDVALDWMVSKGLVRRG